MSAPVRVILTGAASAAVFALLMLGMFAVGLVDYIRSTGGPGLGGVAVALTMGLTVAAGLGVWCITEPRSEWHRDCYACHPPARR